MTPAKEQTFSRICKEQHFIVIAGRTEDKRYIINDPMETHYTKGDVHVKNGYDNGFADYYLTQGFSGGWIFDKADMPEEPFLFNASMPEQQESRYQGYVLTMEDTYTLACFAWAEAKDESAETKQAVLEVVLNRLMSKDYPNTVHDVIYNTEFYRAVEAMKKLDEPGLECYLAVNYAMYGPYVLPADVLYYSAWEAGEEPWGQLGSYTFYKDR